MSGMPAEVCIIFFSGDITVHIIGSTHSGYTAFVYVPPCTATYIMNPSPSHVSLSIPLSALVQCHVVSKDTCEEEGQM